MADSNSYEFCDVLKVQDFEMTKIVVEVPVIPDAPPAETAREMKKVQKKLAKRDKKLRKIMRDVASRDYISAAQQMLIAHSLSQPVLV